MRCQRVHQPYEIGGASDAPRADIVGSGISVPRPVSGGRSQTAAPCGFSRPAGPPAPAGDPGGGGASMWPPAPIALRSGTSPPHSSQSSSPGSSSALPAATSSRIRSPLRATGKPGARACPRCRSAANPACSRHVQDVEVRAHDQTYRKSPRSGTGHCRPSQFVLVPLLHITRGIARVERAARKGECGDHAEANRRKGPRVTLGSPGDAQSADIGAFGAVRRCGVVRP